MNGNLQEAAFSDIFVPMQQWMKVALCVCLIVLAGFGVYANSLKGEFLWDDEWIVASNPYIRTFKFLPQIFTTGLFQAYGVGKGSFYRPIQLLTYSLDYKIWGLPPFGYHLTNTILHVSCAILLFIIVNLLTGDRRPGFIAAILFVVHPINTQAVTYISGRADPLSVVFMLASLLCFIKYWHVRNKASRIRLYASSFIFFVLALLSKETALVLPLFFVLYVITFEGVPGGQKKGQSPAGTVPFSIIILPFFAIIAFYAILRLTVLNFSEGSFLANTPLYLRLATTCKNIFAYLGLLIAPVGLHMERRIIFVDSIINYKVMFSLIVLFLIFAWMARMRKTKPSIFFFAGWFFLGFLPVSNIFPLNATLAEHWVYFPSMGVFALVGIGCVWLLDYRKNIGPSKHNLVWLKTLGIAVPVFVVTAAVGLGYLTVRRNSEWRDALTLYLATKEYVPGNYKVRNNIGRLYFKKGMTDEAIEEYKVSLEIQPEYAQARSNLGVAYSVKGQHEKAIVEYKKALELRPDLSKTYRNLADSYIKVGETDKALQAYEAGIGNCPNDAYLHSLYGIALAASGRGKEGIARGKKALDLSYRDAKLHYNLAIIYEYNGKGERYGTESDPESARSEYLRALKLDPGYHHAYYNLAVLYEYNADGIRYGPGFDADSALNYYKKALQIDPRDSQAKENIKHLLDLTGR